MAKAIAKAVAKAIVKIATKVKAQLMVLSIVIVATEAVAAAAAKEPNPQRQSSSGSGGRSTAACYNRKLSYRESNYNSRVRICSQGNLSLASKSCSHRPRKAAADVIKATSEATAAEAAKAFAKL